MGLIIENPLLTLFLIIAIGLLIGAVRIKNVSLGAILANTVNSISHNGFQSKNVLYTSTNGLNSGIGKSIR